jgi:outer membrane protein TolC
MRTLVVALALVVPGASAQQLLRLPPSKALPGEKDPGDTAALRLEDVLASVQRHYPPLLAALQDKPIAEAEYLAAQGRFDLAIKSVVDTYSFGFYENARWDVGVEQPTTLWGATLFSNYMISDGRYAAYDGKNETNAGGEYKAGLRLPLLQNRPIDSRRAELQKTGIGRRLAELSIDQQRIVIVQQATRAYWDWVAAGRRYAVAQAILQIAEERDKILTNAVELGQLPRFEVEDNRRIILQRRNALIETQRGLEQAQIALSLFFRDEQGRPKLAAPATLPPGFPEPKLIDDGRLSEDVELALQRRPEIARFGLQRDQAKVDLNLFRNQRLPVVDMILGYERELGSGPVKRGPNDLRAAVTFDIPLQRRTPTGRVRATEARITQIEQRERFQREQVEAEVRDAVSAVRAAFQRAQTLQGEVQQTRQVEDAERTRYELGDSNLFVLNTREIQTADAAVREVTALADYFRAFALYELAIAEALAKRP